MESTRRADPGKFFHALRGQAPLILAIVGGLLITGVGFRISAELTARRTRADFDRFAGDRIQAVQRKIESQLTSLEAVHAYLETTRTEDRLAFEAFATRLLERDPGIQAIEWIPRVPAGQRAAYESRAVQDGLAGFTFTEQDASGAMVPAAARSEYFPVYFVTPQRENARLLGFDVASNLARRQALQRSRDVGEATATGRMRLVRETEDQFGVLILLPRYRSGERVDTLRQRRATLQGFVVGVLRIENALEAAMADFDPAGIDVAVTDGSALPEQALLAFHDGLGGKERDFETAFDVEDASIRRTSFVVAGRTWTVLCAPTAAFVNRRTPFLPWFVLFSGLALTGLQARYLAILRGHRRIDAALIEGERRYRTLVENAPESIVVLDVDQQRFVDANQKAVRLFGLPREELLRIGPADLSPPLQPDGRASAEVAREAIGRAVEGEKLEFEWLHRGRDGKEIPCEIRLVRLPASDRRLVRGSITDITERKKTETRQSLLMRELDHRVKNNLAAVLALAEQSLVGSSSLDTFHETYCGRIHALARAHEALADAHWEGVELGEIVRLNLEAFMDVENGRVAMRGDPILLPARASLPICMALHELATNATKYGAFSRPDGRVRVNWERDEDGVLRLCWIERGGPSPTAEPESGFGTSLIKDVIEYELQGRVELNYEPAGLCCRMTLPLENVARDAAEDSGT